MKWTFSLKRTVLINTQIYILVNVLSPVVETIVDRVVDDGFVPGLSLVVETFNDRVVDEEADAKVVGK